MIANQNILMDIIDESVTFVTLVQTKAVYNVTGTSVTGAFDVVPANGNLLLFFYRTTSGAPTGVPAGVSALTSIDNNSLGIYAYTKVASAETNSYIFSDASSNEKGVICIEISNYTTGASVYLTSDTGSVSTATNYLPSSETQLYPAGAYVLGIVVLRDNRSIARSPFDFALGAPTSGAAGTFRLYVAFKSLVHAESFRMEFSWASATRSKALSVVIT